MILRNWLNQKQLPMSAKPSLLVLLPCLSLGITACDVDGHARERIARLEALRSEDRKLIDELGSVNDVLSKKLEESERVQRLEREAFRDQHRFAHLRLNRGGFQRIETATGTFVVGLESVVPEGAGHRITINLGNPQSLAYSNVSLTVAWGRRNDKDTYETWARTLHSTKVPVPGELRAASWTRVSVVATPATSPDVETVRIEMGEPSIHSPSNRGIVLQGSKERPLIDEEAMRQKLEMGDMWTGHEFGPADPDRVPAGMRVAKPRTEPDRANGEHTP